MWGPLLGSAVVATLGEAGAGYGLGEFMISGLLMMLVILFFPVGIVQRRRQLPSTAQDPSRRNTGL